MYMNAITYSAARQNLAKIMNQICDEHEPIIITRKAANAVIMLSLEDFHALQETAYLLKSPKNARHLRNSISQYENGEYQEMDLIE